MRKAFRIPISRACLPYNFEYHLAHYVFAPWVREGPPSREATEGRENTLARLFVLPSGKRVLVRIGFRKTSPTFTVTLESKRKISRDEAKQLVNLMRWCYAVDEPVREFYGKIVKKDRVLRAAAQEIHGAHLRNDPSVFEAILGVVTAQNVQFQRIYRMMELLCQKFGESEIFHGKRYFAFPTPQRLARASLKRIRSCKVGYRDKFIKAIAQRVVKNKLNLDTMRTWKDGNAIREKLIELPAVGPYTADLVLAIGFGRPSFHLDLFSREALWQFYFKGRRVKDETLRAFAEKRWGKWKRLVMMLLTTNTDTWAKKIGLKFRLRSGAKSPAS